MSVGSSVLLGERTREAISELKRRGFAFDGAKTVSFLTTETAFDYFQSAQTSLHIVVSPPAAVLLHFASVWEAPYAL